VKRPPVMDHAIERTPEFRRAMGLPTEQELRQMLEWQAHLGLLKAEDYLAAFGDFGGPVIEINHGNDK
jgi:hypothetical protein